MVRLHFNESALRYAAECGAADRDGRLLYRKSKDTYHERYFKLCGNLLFYFRTNERGEVCDLTDPVGVLVLAGCRVQLEEFGDRPFVFSIVFDGEEGLKHFFSGQSLRQCEEWVAAMKNSSHQQLRDQLELLRRRVQQATGRDPLADMKPAIGSAENKVAQPAGIRRVPPPPTAKKQAPLLPPPPERNKSATFYLDTPQSVAAPSRLRTSCPQPVPSDAVPTAAQPFKGWETFN